ncbi:MAG: methylated-DNA--[protein]-cysteine S-methyltransferase [Bacteroidetes bacterium]|nr:methylated-DNA--[protein]-cysteine S-methyltransferase [Bacteroidota bacterium]
MAQLFVSYFPSPVGWIKIVTNGSALHEVSFEKEPGLNESHAYNTVCQLQMEEYFQGHRKLFKLELDPQGTDFQKKTWNALLRIPFGTSISYHHLALWLGNPLLTRAVGSANAHNPVAIIIPCHRVIGADGSLVGYGGGLRRKQWLLDHERNVRFGTQSQLTFLED